MSEAAAETRGAAPFVLEIPTRWNDNDIYGHVNNVEYLAFFDTVINTYLITDGGLDIEHGPVIGLCAESHCTYRAAFTFPETVQRSSASRSAGANERALRDRPAPSRRLRAGRHRLLRACVRRSHRPAADRDSGAAARCAPGPGRLERESGLRPALRSSSGTIGVHPRWSRATSEGGVITSARTLAGGWIGARYPAADQGSNCDLRTRHGSPRWRTNAPSGSSSNRAP